MINANELLKKAATGFRGLEISEKYIESTVKWLKTWLNDTAFKDYVPQIAYLIEREKGLVGVGPNRINTLVIKSSDRLDLQYSIKHSGKKVKQNILKDLNVHKYHKWPYLILIIGWCICFSMMLLFAGLKMLGLYLDETLPQLFGIILGGLTLILGKFIIEDLRTDNKIRLMFVSQYFKEKVDQEKEHGSEN